MDYNSCFVGILGQEKYNQLDQLDARVIFVEPYKLNAMPVDQRINHFRNAYFKFAVLFHVLYLAWITIVYFLHSDDKNYKNYKR